MSVSRRPLGWAWGSAVALERLFLDEIPKLFLSKWGREATAGNPAAIRIRGGMDDMNESATWPVIRGFEFDDQHRSWLKPSPKNQSHSAGGDVSDYS